MSVLELFCSVDDFCQEYASAGAGEQVGSGKATRRRSGEMHLSEIMTIVIHFHQSHYRDFKAYYTEHVSVNMRSEFPKLVSYGRFIELMPRTFTALSLYVQRLYGACSGV